MIEDFSSGYYRTIMDIQEYKEGPAIEESLYDYIDEKLYVDSTSPVTMRVGLNASPTFQAESERTIPRDVLALPQDMFEESGEANIFILKPEYHYG